MNPLAGFLNTVKAGAVVPLKFNVVTDGVEKTTTSGLTLTLRTINCDTNAPEDPVEVEVAGNTGLHYDRPRISTESQTKVGPGRDSWRQLVLKVTERRRQLRLPACTALLDRASRFALASQQ